MSKSRRDEVWQRAEVCCEYCQMPQHLDVQPFQIDHIRSRKHGGATVVENLALSCLPCNSYKGPNPAGYDPDTGAMVALFNPRTEVWNEHFTWDGPTLLGKTPVGRATIVVLRINDVERIEHRRMLIQAGLFRGGDV